MSELSNRYPSWGQEGISPGEGAYYESGDQVNEANFDFLWDASEEDRREINGALKRRVTDFYGDIAIDGLTVSNNGDMTVDVASSSGAYVNGEFTGPTSSQTFDVSSNNGSSERTDSIYIDIEGNIIKQTGSSSIPSDGAAIAYIYVSTTDSVTVENVINRSTMHVKSDTEPSGLPVGSTWFDSSNNVLKVMKPSGPSEVIDGGGMQGDLDMNGHDIWRVNRIGDPYGAGSEVQLGALNGPHRLSWGHNTDFANCSLHCVYRTGPQEFHIETAPNDDTHPQEKTYFSVSRDGKTDMSGSDYVVLPTRTSKPSNAPDGAMFIME